MAGGRERLAAWAKSLKRDVLALYLAARDPRVPLLPKAMAGLIAAYALSPVDLIPDFIPVLGYLDELILLPGALWLVLRLIDPEILAEHRAAAAAIVERPVSTWGAAFVIVLWAICAGVLVWALCPSGTR